VSDEQVTLLDRVLGNTRNLNALIDDILFFVQLEADRMLLRPQRVAVAELIDGVVEALPNRPAADKVALCIEVDPTAPALHVDAGIVRRVLFHLLSNAFKFTANGTITVRVRPGDERGRAEIAVTDTGVGIPTERVEELFDLFAQADSSTTRRYSGLGMGLTLVQRCTRLLGGEVTVESQPGQGSTFRVSLPDVLGEVAPDESPDPQHTLQ
jgi:signal transduction histidine kinase